MNIFLPLKWDEIETVWDARPYLLLLSLFRWVLRLQCVELSRPPSCHKRDPGAEENKGVEVRWKTNTKSGNRTRTPSKYTGERVAGGNNEGGACNQTGGGGVAEGRWREWTNQGEGGQSQGQEVRGNRGDQRQGLQNKSLSEISWMCSPSTNAKMSTFAEMPNADVIVSPMKLEMCRIVSFSLTFLSFKDLFLYYLPWLRLFLNLYFGEDKNHLLIDNI